ncbi:MAG TPA: HlyD family efflux transporter periplasmic adaptor subunit, partial [Nevskiaceae bacterium]|nr:HlyD family efflux transporter periplasmic adaptor subunit [Nevskiaceae bacterium]
AQRQASASSALVEGTETPGHPAVQAARAAFVDASLRLQRTRILAAVEGDVVQRTAQPGQQVAPGQALMRVVDTDSLWIDANFKESQLRNLRIGQPVTVEVDLYGGGVEFEGKVVGFSAGTGSAFALLPPQNAAGNWVKVVQRVPVRISLSPEAIEAHPLIVGLSARVNVDTHDREGARLSSVAPPAVATVASNPGLAAAQAEADRIIADNSGNAS